MTNMWYPARLSTLSSVRAGKYLGRPAFHPHPSQSLLARNSRDPHHPPESVDQPVEHAATLEDIRAEVLSPDRLNALVFGGFAAVALLIAVVGVAGVLAFSVPPAIREFGVRLALGSTRRRLLAAVVREGLIMAILGVVAGALCGFALARLAGSYFAEMRMPDTAPVIASVFVLLAAAVIIGLVLRCARGACRCHAGFTIRVIHSAGSRVVLQAKLVQNETGSLARHVRSSIVR